jgi:sulfatase maturation enzyme AslB (radical SAM superfamily)
LLRYKKIFLGGPCNNNCIYCPADHKDLPQVDFSTIRNSLDQKESDSVVLHGGEPTLRKDLPDIVNAARDKGFRRIKLLTNGRALSNTHYLGQVMNAGCSLFEITLWGSNPNLHEYLSRAAGSFWETITGIENISAVPHDKFVCLRIPICKGNLSDLENIVITALNLGTNRIILSMQDPALSLQEVLPHIINSINISIFNRVWILTEGLPFCLMQGLEQHISEIYSGWETLYEKMYQHHKQCAECVYKELCPGTEVRYVKQFGDREFLPVIAGKCFRDIKVLYD